MKKTLFALVVIAILSLAGCSTGPETQNTSVEAELNKDTIVTAVRTKNLELCGTLNNDQQKQECITKVNDAVELETTLASGEIDGCKKIQEESTKDQCEILIKDQQKEAQKYEDELKENEKVNEIVSSGDVEDCKEITDANFRKQCEVNIYMQQAANSNDPKPCNNIVEESLKADCLEQITQ